MVVGIGRGSWGGLLVLAACHLNSGGIGGGASAGASEGSSGASSGPTMMSSSGPEATTNPGGGATSMGSTSAGSGPETTTTPDPDSGTDAGSTTRTDSGATESGESSTGSEIEAQLPTLRIELSCMEGFCPHNPSEVCAMEQTVSDQSTLEGEEGVVYDVTIQVRGVVEMSSYIGGAMDGPVYVGGTVNSYWSPFWVEVSDPAQTYWLNPEGEGDLFTHGVDYSYTLPVADGATVELFGDSGDDSCGLFNHDMGGTPIVVPGVPPAPAPFDGQFLQIDAVMLTPI